MPRYRIGCSGFLYDSWRGVFYPEHLPHNKWLSFYMSKFNTVELNVTFYRLLKKEAFERWYKETPPDFTFSLKGSRFISHVKKLKDVDLPISTFFNATAPLMEKLEVVLWQLPPNLKLNMRNLEDFVDNLKQYPVRHVFEFRHKSWLAKKVFNLLSAANIGICMADWPEFINDLPVTADFVYIRRHGEGGSYATNYSTEQLKKDAKKIKDYLKLGKDVYFYFNNDAFAYAPRNALELIEIVESIIPKSLKEGVEPARPRPIKAKTLRKREVKKKSALNNKTASKKTTVKKAIKPAKKTAAAVRPSAKKTALKKAKKTTSKKVVGTAVKSASGKIKKTFKKTLSKTAAKKTNRAAKRAVRKK